MPIDTAHLQLLPYAPEHLLALIEGVPQFEAKIGQRAAEGLRDYIVSDEISPAWHAQLRAAREPDVWVHGFGIVHRESGSVIGSAGFKGPPNEEGMVEIAYGIVPSYQGRGYATEAARSLVAALREAGWTVVAHIHPGHLASQRVARAAGLSPTADVRDGETRWVSQPATAT